MVILPGVVQIGSFVLASLCGWGQFTCLRQILCECGKSSWHCAGKYALCTYIMWITSLLIEEIINTIKLLCRIF